MIQRAKSYAESLRCPRCQIMVNYTDMDAEPDYVGFTCKGCKCYFRIVGVDRIAKETKIPKRITEDQAIELARIFAKHLKIPVDKAIEVIKKDSKFEVISHN